MFKYIYKNISALLFFELAWISFSQIFDKFLLTCGLFGIFFAIILLNYLRILPSMTISLRGIIYGARVLYDIWVSSVKLTKIIWSEKIIIEPYIGVVNFKNLDDAVLTTMRANAITMTPGTIVIGIYEYQMLVHFADKNDYSDQPSKIIERIIL